LKNLNEIKASVAIPVYNEQRSLRDFLECLLSQTLKPDEIIFCDGGSSDKTLSILRQYQDNNPTIKIVNRDGVCRGAGRNSAIESSKNDFVALIDVGNLPVNNWLELLVEEIIENSDIEVVYGAVCPQQDNLISKSLSSFILGRRNHNQLLDRSVASMIIKKEAWRKAGKFPQSDDGSYVVEDLRFLEKLEALGLKTTNKQSALTNWGLPESYVEIYKRFFNLNLGSHKNGYSKLLLKGILRNYAICFLMLLASALVNMFFLFLIPIFLFFRVYSYHRFNMWFKESNFYEKSSHLITGIFVFSVIDMASINSFLSARFYQE